MSVEKLVQLKVVIVLSKRIVEGLGNPEPSKDKKETEGHEDWVVEVDLKVWKFQSFNSWKCKSFDNWNCESFKILTIESLNNWKCESFVI